MYKLPNQDNVKFILKRFQVSQVFLKKEVVDRQTIGNAEKEGVGLRSSQLIIIQGRYIWSKYFTCVW